MALKNISSAAKVLSQSGASKGGKARAQALTAEARSEQARRAVLARWEKAGKAAPVPKTQPTIAKPSEPNGMPYSMYPGTLRMGGLKLPCHVLSDGRRVLTQKEVTRVLTGNRNPTSLSRYLSRIDGFNPAKLSAPIPFKIPGLPTPALGYEATMLIDICDAYVDAWNGDKLVEDQVRIAVTAETIIRACAKVGIIALIDEATGYQKVRAKQALQIKLQAFIADDMQEWARMFPEEFWHELARLESVHYSARHRPLRWGKYVMAFVYDAIDPDVGKALRAKNPNPHFLQNHHQWLREHGKDRVRHQIGQAVGIMKTCEDMVEFKRKFSRIFDRPPIQLTLDDLN